MRFTDEIPFGSYTREIKKYQYSKYFKSKLLPGWLRRAARKPSPHYPVDKIVNGVKFRCYPGFNAHDNFVYNETLFSKEKDELDFLFAQLSEGGVFIDIGGNTGTISIPVAVHCNRVERIVTIEPDPLTFSRLCFNIFINDLAKIEPIRVAIGQEKKKIKIYRNSVSNVGQNSIFKKKSGGQKFFECNMRTLTDVLHEKGITKIAALKIDIEGYEDRALIPFFLNSDKSVWPKAVLIEHISFQDWETDCIQWMTLNGYKIEKITKMNTFLTLGL